MYVGELYVVTIEGRYWKPVDCEKCHAQWAYEVALQAQGEGRSPYFLDPATGQGRARQNAELQMERLMVAASADIPCPKCGHYQSEMVRRLQRKEHPWLFVAAVLFFAAPPVAFAIADLMWGLSTKTIPAAGVGYAVSIVAGLATLCLRHFQQKRYDPNNPAERARRAEGARLDVMMRSPAAH